MAIKLKGISTIILDIEGTLCPIWFVARVLYPYATANLSSVVTSRWTSEDFQPYKAAFPDDVRASPESVISHCQALAAKDIKDPAWKKLQGLIWRQGYADGVLAVPLFRDVTPRLKIWRADGYKLAIFSSGSVEAQKLFFKYVDPDADLSSNADGRAEKSNVAAPVVEPDEEAGTSEADGKRKAAQTGDGDLETANGARTQPRNAETSTSAEKVKSVDLNGLFDANYDTVNAGSKVVADSYKKIVGELGKSAEECLFLSDNVKEIAAAREAGLHAVVVDRPGNAALSDEDRRTFEVIESLDTIDLLDRP